MSLVCSNIYQLRTLNNFTNFLLFCVIVTAAVDCKSVEKLADFFPKDSEELISKSNQTKFLNSLYPNRSESSDDFKFLRIDEITLPKDFPEKLIVKSTLQIHNQDYTEYLVVEKSPPFSILNRQKFQSTKDWYSSCHGVSPFTELHKMTDGSFILFFTSFESSVGRGGCNVTTNLNAVLLAAGGMQTLFIEEIGSDWENFEDDTAGVDLKLDLTVKNNILTLEGVAEDPFQRDIKILYKWAGMKFKKLSESEDIEPEYLCKPKLIKKYRERAKEFHKKKSHYQAYATLDSLYSICKNKPELKDKGWLLSELSLYALKNKKSRECVNYVNEGFNYVNGSKKSSDLKKSLIFNQTNCNNADFIEEIQKLTTAKELRLFSYCGAVEKNLTSKFKSSEYFPRDPALALELENLGVECRNGEAKQLSTNFWKKLKEVGGDFSTFYSVASLDRIEIQKAIAYLLPDDYGNGNYRNPIEIINQATKEIFGTGNYGDIYVKDGRFVIIAGLEQYGKNRPDPVRDIDGENDYSTFLFMDLKEETLAFCSHSSEPMVDPVRKPSAAFLKIISRCKR